MLPDQLDLPSQAVIEWIDLNLDEIEEIGIAQTFNGIGGFTIEEATRILQEADEIGLIVSEALPGLLDILESTIEEVDNDIKTQENSDGDMLDNRIADILDNIASGLDDSIDARLIDAIPELELFQLGWNPFDWPSDAAGVVGELIVRGFDLIFGKFLDLSEDALEDSMIKMNRVSAKVARKLATEIEGQGFISDPSLTGGGIKV